MPLRWEKDNEGRHTALIRYKGRPVLAATVIRESKLLYYWDVAPHKDSESNYVDQGSEMTLRDAKISAEECLRGLWASIGAARKMNGKIKEIEDRQPVWALVEHTPGVPPSAGRIALSAVGRLEIYPTENEAILAKATISRKKEPFIVIKKVYLDFEGRSLNDGPEEQ